MITQALETQVGIIADQLQRARGDIQKLSDKIDSVYVTRPELNGVTVGFEKRITEIESNNTWLVRTIIGAIIIGMIGFFFVFTK